jgi:hypothetical protein
MTTCLTCDGEGVIVTCCDDMCVGLGFCIHGDGFDICPDCGGEGDSFDDDFDEGFYYDDPDLYPDGPTLFDASIGEDVLSDEDKDTLPCCQSCGGEFGDGWTTCTCEKDR